MQPKSLINGRPFCDVKGYISPVTQFEALLPIETWRGDYLQQGCGGLCGKADVSLDDPSRTSGYQAPFAPLQNGEMVVAADDQGHEAPTNADALWARNDLRLRAVFGYSSEHQLARAMKAVIRAFYGRRPTYAYFSGVSDGGHEALVLAQRYPADFDGIIAGAPANNWAPLVGLVAPWVAAANQDKQGKQILTAEKLPALHAAVMAACADPNGVIKDPRACAFDPASMRCPAGLDQPSCLTDAQIGVVRDEYRGPSDKDGHGLFDGGEPYGSELAWANWLVMPAADNAAPADTYAAVIGLAYLNEMAFSPNAPGAYSLGTVPFTAEMRQRLEQLGGIYNATDPNLSAFAANGGKIIIYHSWADQAIPPFASINYYRAVVGQAGGLPAAQSFAGSTWFLVSTTAHADSRLTEIPRRLSSSCLSSSLGSSTAKRPARSPCLSPRRLRAHMWPLSASIPSTPCNRRRTTTGSIATTTPSAKPAITNQATSSGVTSTLRV